jgi:hypothetical protein
MNMTSQLDLVRFAYVLKARLDDLGLSYRQIRGLTGCSVRVISHACNGKPVNAGATFMLAQLAQIDLADMLPTETREMLFRIKKMQQKHGVTPPVSREKQEIEA